MFESISSMFGKAPAAGTTGPPEPSMTGKIGEYFSRPLFSKMDPKTGQPVAGDSSMTGMTPNSFGSIAGMLGKALSAKEPDSWQHQVGQVGADVNQQQLGAIAKKNENENLMELFKMLYQATPPKASDSSKGKGSTTIFNLTPSAFGGMISDQFAPKAGPTDPIAGWKTGGF